MKPHILAFLLSLGSRIPGAWLLRSACGLALTVPATCPAHSVSPFPEGAGGHLSLSYLYGRCHNLQVLLFFNAREIQEHPAWVKPPSF